MPFVFSLCVLAIMSGKFWREEKFWVSGNITETEHILDHEMSIDRFIYWNIDITWRGLLSLRIEGLSTKQTNLS